LPGTFDSLDLVQDTGVTPSPRVHTPAEEDSKKSLGRRFQTSISVRISGAGYGENNFSYPENDKTNTVDHSGAESTYLSATNVPNNEKEEDDKSIGSESYTTAVSSLSFNFCKICHCGEEDGEPPLITPCLCSGSLKFVHQECLHRWIKSSDIKRCELCKFTFIMQSKVKPLSEWEMMDMSDLERRKLCCSVTFHLVAITCVVWSLYVLIDRTADEVQSGDLQWPFWTKLVVVAIGFTGGLVFMYIQCKIYIQICKKWKAYNRTIVVQDLPPEVIKDQRLAIMEARKPGKEDAISDTDQDSEITSSRANSAQSWEGEERSNAETQTALRGISLENIIRNNRVESSSSDTSDISVATISRLLEQMDGPASVGMVAVPTVIFFTDKEVNRNKRFSNRRSLAEPLLICDLPGQNINLGDRIRSNNQDGVGLENLDNNNQGSDMSFDVETLRTLPVIDGAQNPSETL